MKNSLFLHRSSREIPRVSTSSFLVANHYSFRLVSRRRTKNFEAVVDEVEAADAEFSEVNVENAPAPVMIQVSKERKSKKATEGVVTTNTDESKRLFLRLAGVAGLGMVAATVLPKKAEALMLGSSPQSTATGVKNAAGTRINPATEDTLALMKAQTDKLTFDAGSNPANLKVNIAAGIVGVKNVGGTTVNPATEDTLALMKAQTDKLTFDGGTNLLTSVGGTGNIVGLKDTTGTQLNPATDDSLVYLRRMVKLMESQGTVDVGNRQRVVVDAFGTGIVTGVGNSGAGVPRVTVSTDSAFSTTITSFLGAGDQAFQDVARNTYANGIRANLQFS